MPDWETFERQVQDAHDDVFAFPVVTIYNFTGGYDPATGETDNFSPDTGIETRAEVTPAGGQAGTVVGPDGQSSEVSVRIRLPKRDVNVADLVPVGTENARPTEIDTGTDRYVVAERYDEQNGLWLCLCVEVE